MKSFNKRCLAVLSATLLSLGAGHAVVDKQKAQILAAKKAVFGSITEIKKVNYPHSGLPGIILKLRTKENRLQRAHLGPEWALLNERLELKTGDSIMISGALVQSGNKPVLLVKSVKKAGRKITLVNRKK